MITNPSEETKIKIWNEIYHSNFKCPGITKKRLDKLKNFIWNGRTAFWFFVISKPEDIQFIILSEMMHRGIYKPLMS
jgi:hypothetical protein